MIFLVAGNLIALLISVVIFLSLTSEYKKLYLLGVSLSAGVVAGFMIIKYGLDKLTFVDAGMILYRGGLLLALFGGALACFVATKLVKK